MKLKIREKSFRKCIQNMSTIELSWQFEKCNKDEDQKNFLGKDFRILAFAKKDHHLLQYEFTTLPSSIESCCGDTTLNTKNNVYDNYWFSGSDRQCGWQKDLINCHHKLLFSLLTSSVCACSSVCPLVV